MAIARELGTRKRAKVRASNVIATCRCAPEPKFMQDYRTLFLYCQQLLCSHSNDGRGRRDSDRTSETSAKEEGVERSKKAGTLARLRGGGEHGKCASLRWRDDGRK